MKWAVRQGRALHRRLGHRGRSLLFIAYLSGVFAAGLLAAPSPAMQTSLGWLLPLPVWAVLWLATGITCLVGAWAVRDRWAYAVAIAMVTVWAMLYLVSWWPLGLTPRGLFVFAIYIPFALFLLNIASWREHVTADPEALNPGYPSAVITADRRGVITDWRGAAPLLFGWHAAEAIGRPLTDLMPERYRAAHTTALAALDRTGRTRIGRTLYVHGLHRTGVEVPLSLYVTVANTGAGHILTAVVRQSPAYGQPWPGEAIPP